MREAVPAQPPRPSQLHLQVGGDSRGAPGQGLGGGGPGWSGLGAGMAQPEPGLWSLTPPRAPMWHWREAQSPALLTRVGVGAAGASPPPHPPAAGAGGAGLPERAGTSIAHRSSLIGGWGSPAPPPSHAQEGRPWGVASPAWGVLACSLRPRAAGSGRLHPPPQSRSAPWRQPPPWPHFNGYTWGPHPPPPCPEGLPCLTDPISVLKERGEQVDRCPLSGGAMLASPLPGQLGSSPC